MDIKVDTILQGDALEVLKTLPDESIGVWRFIPPRDALIVSGMSSRWGQGSISLPAPVLVAHRAGANYKQVSCKLVAS